MHKFSLQIDDSAHSLTAEDGLSIDLVGDLLKNLYNAIDSGSKTKCTLYDVRGNCYALDFATDSEQHKNNFVRLHRDLQELPLTELSENEIKYATTLKLIFKRGFYINVSADGEKIVHLTNIKDENAPAHYFIQKTIYGIIAEQGGKTVDTKDKHIILDGYPKKIKISNELDMELKQFYRTDKLAIKIRVKVSLQTGNEFQAELVSFRKVGNENFMDKLSKQEDLSLNILDGVSDIEGIINRLYGS